MSFQSVRGIGMTSQRTRDRLVQRLVEQGIEHEPLLALMGSLPRHIFLDEALAHRAYEDSALPIGFQQTISQPYIVARMTELLLGSRPLKRVLEIGTGCGYQTAVLSHFAEKVYSVERIQPLQVKAKQRLSSLGLRNIFYKHADGGMGWPAKGPFDAILSAAAPREIPAELLQQLAPGGRLVIPVGEDGAQELMLLERTDGGVKKISVEPVRFVPLKQGVING